MVKSHIRLAIPLALLGCLPALPAAALLPAVYSFSTGDVDGLMASASRPGDGSVFEIESADDFVITKLTSITGGSFTGLLTGDGSVRNVRVEIYNVFPTDSDTGRTPQVVTRTNSPSDVEFLDRDAGRGDLSFTMSVLNASFTAGNSIGPGGINAKPNQTTGGDGAVTSEEVRFDLSFTDGLLLPANHYFFVPQVEVADGDGDFYWLSATRPITAPGTPFPAGVADLQSWTRDERLAPDWSRIGTDIVGRDIDGEVRTFNAAFSLTGTVVPETSTWAMLLLGFAGLGFAGYRRTHEARW